MLCLASCSGVAKSPSTTHIEPFPCAEPRPDLPGDHGTSTLHDRTQMDPYQYNPGARENPRERVAECVSRVRKPSA
jgi:hypothetical protein